MLVLALVLVVVLSLGFVGCSRLMGMEYFLFAMFLDVLHSSLPRYGRVSIRNAMPHLG